MADTNPLRSFREPNVRIFFGGLVISAMGTWAQTAAVVLLIRELGGGGLELGIATACQYLPLLLLGLYAGAVADHANRHRLTIVLQFAMGLQALALGIVTLAGQATIPIVYGLVLVFGLLSAFDNPSRRTFATELVPSDQLANILALNTSVMTGARIVGPAAAALLVGVIGTGWLFVINGVSFLAFLLAMARIDPSRFHPIERRPRSETPVRDGLRAVWTVPSLRIALVVFALVATFAYNYLVGFPLLVSDRLDADDAVFGWLLSAMSVGNVVGSLTLARLTIVSERWLYGAGVGIFVTLTAISFTTSVPAAMLVAVPMGMSFSIFVNSATLIIQQRTDPQMRSRVLALTSVLFLGSTPIGGPITGVVGDLLGAVWANLYGALITGAAVGVGVLMRRRQVTLPTDGPTAPS